MDESALNVLIQAILHKWLDRYGFQHADVRIGRDHDGDPSIFITAHYSKADEDVDGDDVLSAIGEVRDALHGRGEERFPYLMHAFPEPSPAP